MIALLVLLASLGLIPPKVGAQVPRDASFSVEIRDETWRDGDRSRHLPVRLYLPTGADSVPVVILSHGLGGSRAAMPYLAEYWAGRGYAVVVLQHPGSDASVWEGVRPAQRMRALQEAAGGQNLVLRAGDVSFALDHLAAEAARGVAWAGALDLQRVAVAGHSFGAHTTLAVAGQRFGGAARGEEGPLRDPRVRAAIALSPAGSPSADPGQVWGAVRIPVLHMTGTEDGDPIGRGTTPADRLLPFQGIQGVDQVLVVFNGGDHALFGGRDRPATGRETDARYREHIQVVSQAFLDALLKGDEAAREWLLGGGGAARLGEDARYEVKRGGAGEG